MWNVIFRSIFLVFLAFHLVACDRDGGYQIPIDLFDPDQGAEGNAGDVDKPLDEDSVIDQTVLARLYDSYENVSMVSVSFSFDLQNGQTISFVPPGYPEDPSNPEKYQCTIAVPPGAVSDPDFKAVELVFSIQSFTSTLADKEASNPTTSFDLHAMHEGGVHFDKSIQVTICPHPAASAEELSAERTVLYVEKQTVDGEEYFTYRDLQHVGVDPHNWSFTVSARYFPPIDLIGDKDGGGHWPDLNEGSGGD